MIKLKQAVIVEGKYDKITLENIIDATIITVGGFAIFKDKEKCRLIKLLAEQVGIIIMTDSDQAGNIIRNYLKNICKDGKVSHVYIPQLKGKERRKVKAGKEGYLGVEGLSGEVILKALNDCGINATNGISARKITKTDLFKYGLSGGMNSSALRQDLAAFLDVPQNFSANTFVDIINTFFTPEEFEERLNLWQQERDKK